MLLIVLRFRVFMVLGKCRIISPWGTISFETGKIYSMDEILGRLVSLQFRRAGAVLAAGMFRVLGDTLEIFPSSRKYLFVFLFGDELESITEKIPLTNKTVRKCSEVTLFPAKPHDYFAGHGRKSGYEIKAELEERVAHFLANGKLVEAERIKMKTEYDIEMLQEVGYVNESIENYSHHVSLGTKCEQLRRRRRFSEGF